MGLWVKGLRRNSKGIRRLEDASISPCLLNEMKDYFNSIGLNIQEQRRYTCDVYTYAYEHNVVFDLYGRMFILDVPPGKDNLPWIMQSLQEQIYMSLTPHEIDTPTTRLGLLNKNMQYNIHRWKESTSPTDDMFLHIAYY